MRHDNFEGPLLEENDRLRDQIGTLEFQLKEKEDSDRRIMAAIVFSGLTTANTAERTDRTEAAILNTVGIVNMICKKLSE